MSAYLWRTTILGVIFLPMAVYYIVIAVGEAPDKKLLILLFAPILAVPAIPIMTVGYIGFVSYIFARRCVQPDYDNERGAEKLKLYEAVGEANIQAVLG